MARMPVLALPAGSSSPGLARGFVTSWLTAWGLEHLCDRVLLATSELVTNAVVHGKLPLEVEVETDGRDLRVTVTDPVPRPPRIQSRDARSSTGRGVAIVDDVADAWGSDLVAGNGKAVWCSFRVAL